MLWVPNDGLNIRHDGRRRVGRSPCSPCGVDNACSRSSALFILQSRLLEWIVNVRQFTLRNWNMVNKSYKWIRIEDYGDSASKAGVAPHVKIDRGRTITRLPARKIIRKLDLIEAHRYKIYSSKGKGPNVAMTGHAHLLQRCLMTCSVDGPDAVKHRPIRFNGYIAPVWRLKTRLSVLRRPHSPAISIS